MYRDLRDFLEKLDKEGQLIHYRDAVLPDPDIGAINWASNKLDGGPAVLLDNIKGYAGKRVACGIHNGMENHALMLGMPKTATVKEQFYELAERWEKYSEGKVVWVDNPPCQEVVHDKDINLYKILPLYRVNQLDGGYYFSKPSVVSRDPIDPDNFGKQNVGCYRLQVMGPDTIGMQAGPPHDIGRHYAQAEADNKPLPVAICLGVDPVLSVMASTPIAYDESEYQYAAAINGIPMELTKCLTSNLDVPARAEYIIEGEVIPHKRVVEGPFCEFTGSYSDVGNKLLIQVKKVTHRKDAIFENLYTGRTWAEIDTIEGLNTCVPIYNQIKKEYPEVVAVNALYQHGLTVIVSTHCRFGGFAKAVAMRVASTPHGMAYCKNIFVVDADVDPFNLNEVMWALSVRVRDHNADIIEIPGCAGLPNDPAGINITRKLILDATTPVPPDAFTINIKTVPATNPTVESFRQKLMTLSK